MQTAKVIQSHIIVEQKLHAKQNQEKKLVSTFVNSGVGW